MVREQKIGIIIYIFTGRKNNIAEKIRLGKEIWEMPFPYTYWKFRTWFHIVYRVSMAREKQKHVKITNGIFSEVNLITCTFHVFLSYLCWHFIIRALMMGNWCSHVKIVPNFRICRSISFWNIRLISKLLLFLPDFVRSWN